MTVPVHSHNPHQLLQRVNPVELNVSQPVHFIAIGGVGMSGLAKVLLKHGFMVSGSDIELSSYAKALVDLGAQVSIGHQAQNIPENALVVCSTAIKPDNPEWIEAQRQNLQIVHRSDLLNGILKLFEAPVAITGTHGKTTITGMVGSVLVDGQLDPTIIAGGKIPGFKTNAVCGDSKQYVVIESDESDGTMARYQPLYLAISNLEFDHPDHYPDGLNGVIQAFENYLQQLPPMTTVFFNVACPETLKLFQRFQHQLKAISVYCGDLGNNSSSLGFRPDYWLEDVQLHAEGGYQGQCWSRLGQVGQAWLQVPGEHNLYNAMITIAIATELGVSFESARRTLENFKGMGRRFDKLAQVNGAWVVDDYAHHPTEVLATLNAAKGFNQQRGRVIAVFQPHRYTRLKSLWSEFLNSFGPADEVIVMDVYAAGDEHDPEYNSLNFAKQLRDEIQHPCVDYWQGHDFDAFTQKLGSSLTAGDCLVLMGAGDITQLAHQVATIGQTQKDGVSK